jgi:hypothetical protein
LAFGPDGILYVSEAGVGGDEQIRLPMAKAGTPPSGTPPAPEPAGTRGFTGRVSKITPGGAVSVAAKDLPSYNIEGPVGPAGIAVSKDTIWLAIGGAGEATAFLEPLPNENSVVSINPATGDIKMVADIGAYERAHNPHPAAIDSNLYGLAYGSDGLLYVADAGGNAVYTVNPEAGTLTLLAVLEDLPLPQGVQGPPTVQAVPTGVTPNPTGGVFVSLLSGAPFPKGGAKIVAITTDGKISDAVTGLTMPVDVKVGPDGLLYISQISLDFLSTPPRPGNVIRIAADGSHETVLDGLPTPNGLAFDADGNLYVVVNAVSFGPPAGMVLRCEGVARKKG